MSIEEAALAAAPRSDKSCLIFFNVNLHNYYHWVTEGLLSLHILSQALGPDSNLNVALPKSMDINALFDHRESIRAVGLDGYAIEEVAADLIKVREAVWVDSDLVEFMPSRDTTGISALTAARLVCNAIAAIATSQKRR